MFYSPHGKQEWASAIILELIVQKNNLEANKEAKEKKKIHKQKKEKKKRPDLQECKAKNMIERVWLVEKKYLKVLWKNLNLEVG